MSKPVPPRQLVDSSGHGIARDRALAFQPLRENLIHGFNATLSLQFDEATTHVTASLKTDGFGVFSDIDVQGAMREKLGVKMPPYRILGACNSALAYKALQVEPDIGLLLPCNVVVRQETSGGITVAFVDPVVMMEMVSKPEVSAVARHAESRLRRVCASLSP